MRILYLLFSFLLFQCQNNINENHDEEHHHDLHKNQESSQSATIELQTLSQGIAIAGPWVPPPDVMRIADTQMVASQGSPTIADGGYCDSSNPWECSCHHPACSAGLPGTLAFARYIRQAFPQISSAGGFECCRQNTGNTSKLSVHSIGRAIDLMIPMVNGDADNTAGDAVANWLIMNAASIGIQYIAWDRTSWSGSRPAGSKVSPYQGPIPHIDHIHMELNLDGANQRTPFFRSGAINQPARQCEPRCNGTVIIDANCNEGDCAAFGQNCLADPTPRCGIAECPRNGTAKVCTDDTHIVDCIDGLLAGVGDCGAFAAYCSTAGRATTDAQCVSAFCVSGPNQIPFETVRCSFFVGEKFSCHADASVDILTCPLGQICSMQSGEARCAPPKPECPPVYDRNRIDILNVCIDDRFVARCENGNVASAEECEGNSVCRMINNYPTCVTEQCVSGNTIRSGVRSCLDNGMVGECDQNGAINVVENCSSHELCIQNGDFAYCEAILMPNMDMNPAVSQRDMAINPNPNDSRADMGNQENIQQSDMNIQPLPQTDASVAQPLDMKINQMNDHDFSTLNPSTPRPSIDQAVELNEKQTVAYTTSVCQQNQAIPELLCLIWIGILMLKRKRMI
jgi:hypothetical protein